MKSIRNINKIMYRIVKWDGCTSCPLSKILSGEAYRHLFVIMNI